MGQSLLSAFTRREKFICHYTLKQDRQCTYNITLRRVRVTIVAVEKTVSITYSGCVTLALVIRYAVRMRHIVFRDVPGSTIFFRIIS